MAWDLHGWVFHRRGAEDAEGNWEKANNVPRRETERAQRGARVVSPQRCPPQAGKLRAQRGN